VLVNARMPIKRLLCPQRLRRIPRQFSWIDQRLVREHYIERCDAQALALYLLLLTVADAQGLSYYSDRTVCRLLSMTPAVLSRARAQLIGVALIAHQAPLYQVLALEAAPAAAAAFAPGSTPRGTAPEPIGAALARLQGRFRNRAL
jgi:hypothetical protein